jgi:hypothetical protein
MMSEPLPCPGAIVERVCFDSIDLCGFSKTGFIFLHESQVAFSVSRAICNPLQTAYFASESSVPKLQCFLLAFT